MATPAVSTADQALCGFHVPVVQEQIVVQEHIAVHEKEQIVVHEKEQTVVHEKEQIVVHERGQIVVQGTDLGSMCLGRRKT